MIANASFQDAGAAPGLAAGWTLRSSCAREAIAAFAPGEGAESFERWTAWTSALGAAARAPFAPKGTIEGFDAWPNALFADSMSPGLVDRTMADGFETGWWSAVAAFSWNETPSVLGVFAGGAAREEFGVWPMGATYAVTFPAAALTAAPLTGGSPELFAAWTTKNTTLG